MSSIQRDHLTDWIFCYFPCILIVPFSTGAYDIYQMFFYKCTFNLSSLRIFQITNKFPCEETLLATLIPHDWHWPQRAFHWPCCMGKKEEGIKAGYMGGEGGYDISVLWFKINRCGKSVTEKLENKEHRYIFQFQSSWRKEGNC